MLPPNIQVDEASHHRIEEMSQSDYLLGFLAALETELGAGFAAHDIFVFSGKANGGGPLPRSLERPGERKVLFYLSDETDQVPERLRPHYKAIFKTHLEQEPGGNIHPLCLGCANGVPVLPPVAMDRRTVDIFFSGNLNRGRYGLYQTFVPALRPLPDLSGSRLVSALLRTPLSRLLPRRFVGEARGVAWEVNFTQSFRSGLSPQDYGERLARSRIALCPKGFIGTESFRHTEALRAGCVVLSERLPDTFFYRGSPFVIVETWKDGLERARALLRSPDALADLQRRGLDWFESRLSERAAARYAAARILGRADPGA